MSISSRAEIGLSFMPSFSPLRISLLTLFLYPFHSSSSVTFSIVIISRDAHTEEKPLSSISRETDDCVIRATSILSFVNSSLRRSRNRPI